MLLLFHYLGECQESQREEKAHLKHLSIFGVKTTFKDSEAESGKSFLRAVECPGNDMDLYSF